MERAKALRVNAGTEPDADLGPVISKQVRTNDAPLSIWRSMLSTFMPSN